MTAAGGSRATGLSLVIAQVALCLVLIWLGWRGALANVCLWPGIAAGTVISAGGIWAMRLSRVRITPDPGVGATLCERGIYRHIRHPMYAGLLLAFAMFALVGGVWAVCAWFGLLAVLVMKLRIEERLWSARDAAYRDYQQRTKRLIPGVW